MEVRVKKLFPLFLCIGLVLTSIAIAAENDSSEFVGTWGGVFTSPINVRVRNAAVMKIESDREGKIFISRYELGGSVVSPPPKVVALEPGLLTLETKSGWTIKLTLETKDLIKVRSDKQGNTPYTATFTRQ